MRVPVGAVVLDDLSALFDDLIEVTEPLVIAGDFIAHVNAGDSSTTIPSLGCLDEYGMTQQASSATRTRGIHWTYSSQRNTKSYCQRSEWSTAPLLATTPSWLVFAQVDHRGRQAFLVTSRNVLQ